MTIGAAGLLYGTGRVVLDGFRADTVRFGMTGSQWTGLLMVSVSMVVMALAHRSRSDAARDEAPAEIAP